MAGELLERIGRRLAGAPTASGSGSEAVARVQAAMAEGRRYDVVLMDWRMPDLDGLSAAQLIRQLQGDLPPPMVIMITAYGREALADARPQRAALRRFSHQTGHAQATGRLGAACVARRTGRWPTRRRAWWSAPSGCGGVRLLVVEDNALNRQVAAELLSSEGAWVASPTAGWRAFSRCWRRACRSTRC